MRMTRMTMTMMMTAMLKSTMITMTNIDIRITDKVRFKRIQNNPISMPNIEPKKSGFIPVRPPRIILLCPPSMLRTK